ncbi:Uma2 family endonuclease [Rubrobacter tropicus]|uniref:Uma2 family endonuclease n=1 Tax=Rubrobacter tropicus TaxID=2653851 RepID=A0A6G8Q452_9ACTN|nr:Uma2 family endonuclease [Rubrobacter tropicus]QIN81245.1 Uma2 family endonuclease [Rubrobacter tropicus]
MTVEEFWNLPGDGKWRSLVRGEVVEEMPPGGLHGIVALRLGSRLERWSERGPGGSVGVESGFVLSRDPATVRGPDIFYVRPDHVPDAGVPEAFWNVAPDLAVEVVSPGEKAGDVREKVRDYLAAGTPLVWVVYPRTREVVAHTPDGLARTHEEEGVLEGFEALPGFRCAVSDLFR